MPSHYTHIVLNERPVKDIVENTFRTEKVPFQLKAGDKQVLVRVTWLSLDPAMRGYLNDARSYLPPVKIGEVMRAIGLGVVVEAGPGSRFSPGQTVTGPFGWSEYSVLNDKDVTALQIPPGGQALDFLNSLGSSGMTAYFGLTDVLQLKPGQNLVVSGAAGSVGVLVCQLAKKLGAKVTGIAGSKEKCDWLLNELGIDKVLDYKSPTFKADFKEVGYVDAFFDNVGGEILDMVLTRLNKDARIALCGAISAYNGVTYRLKNYLALISQRATIQGFIVFDYEDRYPEAIEVISKGLSDGSIKRKFHVVEGLEKAPASLPMLFTGGNTGKLVVKVSEDAKANL
ncbi:hypothetical protein C8J56DRAFT_1045535 [Mycena floridula]|nr:hypothetical protein C8J56DRAFT_1045535 [Mycena floridula]